MNKKNIILVVSLIIILAGGILTWHFWLKKNTPVPVVETIKNNILSTRLATIPSGYSFNGFFSALMGKKLLL